MYIPPYYTEYNYITSSCGRSYWNFFFLHENVLGKIIFDSLALRLIIHQLNVRLSDFSSVEINVIEAKEKEEV